MTDREEPKPQPILVWPVKPRGGSTWKNNELRFSLRSVEKFWRTEDGEPPKVFILTTADIPWLDPEQATVIPIRGYAESIMATWELAREHSPTGDYVWMNDDICFLRETRPEDLITSLFIGRMRANRGEKRKDVNGWRWKLVQVRDRVAEMGIDVHDFSSHSPYLFNADRMEITAGLFGLQYKTPLETAYYNFWKDRVPFRRANGDRIIRHKAGKGVPMTLTTERFLNYSEQGCDNAVKGYLAGLFPHKSRYERSKK